MHSRERKRVFESNFTSEGFPPVSMASVFLKQDIPELLDVSLLQSYPQPAMAASSPARSSRSS